MPQGFESVAEGTVGELDQSGSPEEAANAIEGLLDLGQETNPAVGENGVAERPASEETIEQFGQDDNADEILEEEDQRSAEGQDTRQREEDEPTGDLYTVTVQGETRDVTLDELQSGFMLQADYTKKTQGLAEERRGFEENANAVLHERQQYVKLLSALEQQLSNGGEQEPDWVELSRNDPVGYTRQKAAWDQNQTILNAARNERERVSQQQHQDDAKSMAEQGNYQRQLMVAAKPELADPEKAQAYQQDLRQYATNTYGFNDAELGMITDHRQALILEKAMLYDKAMQKGGVVQKKMKSKGPRAVIRPGAARGTEVVRTREGRQAQDRFNRTGDVSDAARLMENFVD
jgi:hypothetical protein